MYIVPFPRGRARPREIRSARIMRQRLGFSTLEYTYTQGARDRIVWLGLRALFFIDVDRASVYSCYIVYYTVYYNILLHAEIIRGDGLNYSFVALVL